MDNVTQKFSVFDFFNLLIAGTLFLVVLAICHYPSAKIAIPAPFARSFSTTLPEF